MKAIEFINKKLENKTFKNEDYVHERHEIEEWMEEYASEVVKKSALLADVSVPLPTDKEIDAECNERFAGNLAPTYFKLGAEWVRDNYIKGNER